MCFAVNCSLQGNVILTDSKYEVLTLLRSHRDDNKDLAIMARHPYPMHAIRLREAVSKAALTAALAAPGEAATAASAPPAAADGDGASAAAAVSSGLDGFDGEGENEQDVEAVVAAPVAAPAGKKGKKGDGSKSATSLKTCLGQVFPYGPAVVEHVLRTAGLDPARCMVKQPLEAGEVAALHGAVQQLETWFASLEETAPDGYITATRVKDSSSSKALPTAAGAAAAGGKKQGKGGKDGKGPGGEGQEGAGEGGAEKEKEEEEKKEEPVWVYQDFNGFRLAQTSGLPLVESGGSGAEVQGGGGAVLQFGSFDDALDEFYSKVRGAALG